eukprot:1160117-Pelagomonas_calceolata.AAC.7
MERIQGAGLTSAYMYVTVLYTAHLGHNGRVSHTESEPCFASLELDPYQTLAHLTFHILWAPSDQQLLSQQLRPPAAEAHGAMLLPSSRTKSSRGF